MQNYVEISTMTRVVKKKKKKKKKEAGERYIVDFTIPVAICCDIAN